MVLDTLHLFAGAGGGILADLMLGHRPIGAVEIEAYPRKVLLARQLDGILPRFPIWEDVTTFRSDNPDCASYIARLRALPNLCISGGFPCQDISAAGKGAGIEGERSGLWSEFARIIGEIMPRYVFVENSPMLTVRGLGTVLRNLVALGFDAEWGVLSAADVGANHQRERIWVLARQRNLFSHTEHDRNGRRKQFTESVEKEIKSRNTKWQLADTDMLGCDDRQAEINATEAKLNAQCEFSASGSDVANADSEHGEWRGESQQPASISGQTRNQSAWGGDEICNPASIRQSRQRQSIKPMCSTQNRDWQANITKPISEREQWAVEPNVGRVANGVAFSVDRLKAIGNGQVPLCAATAFELLRQRLET